MRGVFALVVSVLFVSAAAATLTYDPPEIGTGPVTSAAGGATLVALVWGVTEATYRRRRLVNGVRNMVT